MKPTFKIATATSLAAVIGLFAIASSRSASLERQLQTARIALGIPQDAGPISIDTHQVADIDPVTAADVLQLIPDDENVAPTALIPSAVRLVRKCDSNSLLELAKAMLEQDNFPEEKVPAVSLFAMVYVLLAAEQAPGTALEFYEQHFAEVAGWRDVRTGILLALAKSDPATAASHLQNLPDDERTKRAKASVIGALFESDAQLAINLLESDPEIAQMAASNAALAPHGALALQGKIPQIADAKLRTEVSVGLLASIFVRDGYEEAYTFYNGIEEADTKVRNDVASALATGMASTRPAEALDFATAELEGDGRVKAIASIAGRWARTDFNATARWLGEQTASPARDAAISSFVKEVKSVDPQAAEIWANEISEPVLRQATLEFLITK